MERDPYAPVTCFAKELSGYDIGEEIKQRTCVKRSTWDSEARVYLDDAVYEDRWFKIVMITHKKNGDVRVRTDNGDHRYSGSDQIKVREVNKCQH